MDEKRQHGNRAPSRTNAPRGRAGRAKIRPIESYSRTIWSGNPTVIRHLRDTHHRKTDPQSTRRNFGTASRGQWPSSRDGHRSYSEETSMEILSLAMQQFGRLHPCDADGQRNTRGGHLRCGAQLWSPITWSAKPSPPSPSWEGNTWQGHNGAQSSLDHLLLSVDLSSPPVTVYFQLVLSDLKTWEVIVPVFSEENHIIIIRMPTTPSCWSAVTCADRKQFGKTC